MTQTNLLELNSAVIEKIDRDALLNKFNVVRKQSEKLCSSLETEDYVIQSMPDASPTKWHLAHVSWFFEAFILSKADEGYKSLHPQYNYLFNSYYVQVGERWTRNMRGLLARPTVKDVLIYRNYVDKMMTDFITISDEKKLKQFYSIIETGLHHEQQHQELMITDLKHVFSLNPLNPVFKSREIEFDKVVPNFSLIKFDGGIYEIGHDHHGFSYDNERPRHKVLLDDFQITNRLVTNAEYSKFIEDGGYKDAKHWFSDGFAIVEKENWQAPLYWRMIDGQWWQFTLNGLRKVNPAEPVCHVSFYEADAFARWAGYRLPAEFEWEIVSRYMKIKGNFLEDENFHPVPLTENTSQVNQLFGDVWEWTSSAYLGYPGYKPLAGALGEYNGKFMSGQMVLRGGSCATPVSHIRNTYRNFFPPNARWQFSGIRIAKDN